MAVRKAAAKAKKTAPVVEPEAVEEEELEIDEVEETEEVAEAPAKKKAPEVVFGTKQLADHINEETGSSYDTYNLRILLRKMVKDGTLERTESEGRSRYSFSGPKDPQVKAIVKAIKEGYGEKAKQERLDALKAKRNESKAAKPKKASTKKAAAKKEAPEVLEDEELEIDDDI